MLASKSRRHKLKAKSPMDGMSDNLVQSPCPAICIFFAITIHLNINSLSYFIHIAIRRELLAKFPCTLCLSS